MSGVSQTSIFYGVAHRFGLVAVYDATNLARDYNHEDLKRIELLKLRLAVGSSDGKAVLFSSPRVMLHSKIKISSQVVHLQLST